MANANSFPLVRGRTMRVTKTDGCCGPMYGADNSIVTEGFVSVALTSNITEAEEITVVNASGKTCVRDTGSATFDGYGVELVFCEVNPCLFSMITGQPTVTDSNGDIVGFKMNSKVTLDQSGFSLEVWMGVPGVACEGDSGASGYLLLPCLQGGVVGDFTIENAAITFTISGAATKDGNAWGVGPYPDSELNAALDRDDHLYVIFTTNQPPEETDGCVSLVPAGMVLAASGNTATLTIPTGKGDCWDNELTVSWGDGPAETITAGTSETTHTYSANGTYEVEVQDSAGTCAPIAFTVEIAGVTRMVQQQPAPKKVAASTEKQD